MCPDSLLCFVINRASFGLRGNQLRVDEIYLGTGVLDITIIQITENNRQSPIYKHATCKCDHEIDGTTFISHIFTEIIDED